MPNNRKINGKPLMNDISLSAGDVQAFSQTRHMTRVPDQSYIGAFSCGQEGEWVKGVSIGFKGGDVGQIWLDSSAILHTRFLNTNGNHKQQSIIGFPIGSPIPWPTDTPPIGWLKCNGAKFTKSEYPKLAEIYPSGVLPDLRGEFIRGWDDSRGIDISRDLLSWQDATQLPNIYIYAYSPTQGSLVTPPINSYPNRYPTDNTAENFESPTYGSGQYFSTTNKLIPTGAVSLANFKTRPRNIAFNYILRAK
nr:phage tail protein [Xenorhabdus sp. NBAII XenSa04]